MTGKPILLVGPREQVFHNHPSVNIVRPSSSFVDVKAWLEIAMHLRFTSESGEDRGSTV